MHYRRFGRTGWTVSEIGYGMWGLAGWTGGDDDESDAALERSVELGCNFFDTAWGYGAGQERADPRPVARETLRQSGSTPRPRSRPRTSRGRRAGDSRSTTASRPTTSANTPRRAWRTWASPRSTSSSSTSGKTPGRATSAGSARSTTSSAQGLVRAVGVSVNRWEPANVLETLKTGLIDAVQVIYNIFDQAPEDELFPLCRELDVAVIARVPFDEGTLTGTLTKDTRWPEGDWRNTYFVPENLSASVDRAEALRPLVPPGMTMPELALRWILAEPTVSTIIPGMRKLRNVEANIAASDGKRLDADLMKQLKAHRWDRTPTEWSQ